MSHDDPPKAEIDPSTITSLKAFAVDVVPFFSGLSNEDFLVTTIKGGTTNQLYMVRNISDKKIGDSTSSDDEVPTACVIRVYGKDTDKIISREDELFWQGQFLETYGSNSSMLAYEYLDGFRALKAHEFYPRRHKIARRVAAFHAKATQASIYRPPSDANGETNQTMVMLKNWVALVSDVEKVREQVAPAKRELFDKMGWANGGLLRERDWLLSVIQKNIKKLPVAVCHNDLTCGNFMVNEIKGEEELRFIDFEYTRQNFSYFDLANHFCEYGGLECDFTKFPDRSVIKEFIREYLEAGRKASVISGYVGQHTLTSSSTNPVAPLSISADEVSAVNKVSSTSKSDMSTLSPLKSRPHFDFGSNTFNFAATPPTSMPDPILSAEVPPAHHHSHNTKYHIKQQKLQQAKLLAVSEEEVEEACNGVLFFVLISHFGWTIWGLIQEQVSEIDFGFMDYAWSRWEEYMKRKDEFSQNML